MLFVFFWTEGMAFWNILERRDLGSIQFYLNFVFCRLSHWSLKTSFLKMRTIHTKLGSYEWLLPALCFHFFRLISRETEKLTKMKSQNFGLNTPNDWSIPQTFPGLTQGFTGWALLQFRTPLFYSFIFVYSKSLNYCEWKYANVSLGRRPTIPLGWPEYVFQITFFNCNPIFVPSFWLLICDLLHLSSPTLTFLCQTFPQTSLIIWSFSIWYSRK